MRKRILPVLAYMGAALTLLVAIAVPFYLTGAFTRAFARSGLRIDASYTGGEVARIVDRNGYQIVVYRPVHPHALQRLDPFVQIVFKPADALPPRVDDAIDLDGDGQPDVRVSFTVPANPQAQLRGDVTALNGKYQSMVNAGNESFSRLVVHAGKQIVVRVPLNENPTGR